MTGDPITDAVATVPVQQTSSSSVVSLISPFAVASAEFVGATTTTRKLPFKYLLFENTSGSFKCLGHGCAEGLSGKTVQDLCNAVRVHTKSLPDHRTEKEHDIEVYKVF